VKGLQFGISVNSSAVAVGIMGIGFGADLDYPGFIDNLYTQGVTKLRAFSLLLGAADQGNQSGIIFGGVDTKKFAGPLVTVPILPPQPGDGLNGNNQTFIR
jgi:hypothetical protein